MMTFQEALDRFNKEGRNHFTKERWEEFKEDVKTLKTAEKYWPLEDVGYNPPPSYSFLIGKLSSLVKPTPVVLNFLASIDWVLILVSFIILYRTFGLATALIFILIYTTNPLSNYGWIGGAYFRNLELFSLTCSVCLLEKKRNFLAGMGFGLAIASRLFPIAFLAGATIPLIASITKGKLKESINPLIKLLLGAGLAVSLLVGGSLLQYGGTQWIEFNKKMSLHSKIFFSYHIGYEKIVANSGEEANQYFDKIDNEGHMVSFDNWNNLLNNKINKHWVIYSSLALLLWGLVFFTSLKEKPRIATLIIGECTLFLFTLPANYYYLLLALFCASSMAEVESKNIKDHIGATIRLAIAISIPLIANLLQYIFTDPISINYQHNWLIAIAFLAYVLSLLFTQKQRSIVNITSRKKDIALLLVALFILGIISIHPRRLPSTNGDLPQTIVLTSSDWNPNKKEGVEAHIQTIREISFPTRKEWLAKKISVNEELSFKTKAEIKIEGDYLITFYYVAAPDYVNNARLAIVKKDNGWYALKTSILLHTNQKQVEFKTYKETLHLEEGEYEINYSSENKKNNYNEYNLDQNGNLLGFNSITIRPLKKSELAESAANQPF